MSLQALFTENRLSTPETPIEKTGCEHETLQELVTPTLEGGLSQVCLLEVSNDIVF